jgi:hypothetical protein
MVNHNRPHHIRPVNYRIIQSRYRRMSQRRMLRLSPEEIHQWVERKERDALFAKALVERERAAAMARDVNVVYDYERPYAYSIVALPDEGPKSGN